MPAFSQAEVLSRREKCNKSVSESQQHTDLTIRWTTQQLRALSDTLEQPEPHQVHTHTHARTHTHTQICTAGTHTFIHNGYEIKWS